MNSKKESELNTTLIIWLLSLIAYYNVPHWHLGVVGVVYSIFWIVSIFTNAPERAKPKEEECNFTDWTEDSSVEDWTNGEEIQQEIGKKGG